MFCPYCGKENPDDARYCAGCGNYIAEDEISYGGDSYEGDSYGGDSYGGDSYGGDSYGGDSYGGDSYGGDSYGEEPDGGSGRNRRMILISVVIIAAAAAAVIIILTRMLPSSSRVKDAAAESIVEEAEVIPEETVTEEIPDENIVARLAEQDEAAELVEDDEAEAVEGDAEEAAAYEPAAEDAAEGLAVADFPAESTAAEEEAEPVVLTGAKEKADYTIRTEEANAEDSNGTVVRNADYDLVVLEGDDGVNQKINASLEQDCRDYLDAAYSMDESIAESLSDSGQVEEYLAVADVVYDKNSVLSILYTTGVSDSLGSYSSAYGLTYSLETGDPAGIRDLTDLSDDELMDEIRTALLDADQSDGYYSDASDKINSLTVDEIGGDSQFQFIVEGGEIVIIVPDGVLTSVAAGYFKVPTTVYITTMSYDEYTADYIFPDSSSRLLTRDDLVGHSKEELRLARNEIFARHGRIYRDENLNDYFSSKSWYNGLYYEEDFDLDVFSDIEWNNLALLNAYDKEMGYQ